MSPAEVERLRYDLDHSYSQREWSALTARATSAEQERDRLRAGIEGLAGDPTAQDETGTWIDRKRVADLLAGSGEQPAPTALVRVEWGVVLDDLGSTDVYDTREEAEARADRDSTVVRIETWRVGSGEQSGEDDRHPEAYCHRCGGPNITWWAPSPVWNYVMGYPDEAHDGIVCPLCFAELAEAKGASEGWRVEPGRWPEGVSLVHTDGRVWDDRAGLWVDPAPVVPDSTDVREREALAQAIFDAAALIPWQGEQYDIADYLLDHGWSRAAVGQGVTAEQDGAALIAAERRRQVEVEGWTPEHDAEHGAGALALAAACYALPPNERRPRHVFSFWPWAAEWWKPTPDDRVRELVKAGALIAAEIDRLRAAVRPTGQEDDRS